MSNYVFDKRAWSEKSIFDQMGNIGAEVGRALAAKRRGAQDDVEAAFYRGLDLFDATAEVWAQKKSPRTREILRAREQFVQAITEKNHDTALEDYFMQYAIAARLHR